MELTVENFLYSMGDPAPVCLREEVNKSKITGARQLYLTPGAEGALSEQNIYISTLSQVWNNREYISKGMSILAIRDMGLTREEIQELQGSIWLVDETYDTGYLLNQAFEVFEKYTAWDKNIHIALLEGKSLQELLDLSSDFIKYPTIIFDSSFNVLAYYYPENYTYDSFMSTIRQGYTDAETMDMIRKQPVFAQLEEHPQIVGPAAMDPTKTMIYQRFSMDDNTMGYGAIFTGDRKPRRGYLDFVALCEENINLCFKRDYQQNHYGKMMYESFLRHLLHTPNIPEQQMEDQLRAIGTLQRRGNFILGVLEFAPDTRVPRTFLARILARELWDVQVFLDENRICLLRNMKTLDDEWFSQWESENLAHILENYTYKFGISNMFYDIAQLCYAHRQSTFALQQVQGYENKAFFYQDYTIQDLLTRMRDEMPLEMMQSGPYNQLKHYDNLHKTGYLPMILTYLEYDCNATHAANHLYLHRNTIRKAVAFVEEHFSINLKDPHTKRLLRISQDVEEYKTGGR